MIHMYITNDPTVALIAEKYGVERIWVDLETLGKDVRQFSYNSVKSKHTVDDIKKIKKVLTKSELLVRVNPWHTYAYGGYADSHEEIDAVISAGADLVMLPMWKTVEEVHRFVDSVAGRAGTILLLETKEARQCLDELLKLYADRECVFDEIHIGLNDLHISYGLDFMFELIPDGTVEEICRKIREAGIPYGFGGVAKIGDGAIPAEKILLEHYRLGSDRVILSRTFCDNAIIQDPDEIDRVFQYNMKRLRDYEEKASKTNIEVLNENKTLLDTEIKRVADGIRKKKNQIRLLEEENTFNILEEHAKLGDLPDSFYLLELDRYEKNYVDLKKSFCKIYPHFNIAYSYKTNYIPVICNRVNELGGYAEVVSDLEVEIAIRCGVDPSRIIWNGPVKNEKAVRHLLLLGGNVNADSYDELKEIFDFLSDKENLSCGIGIRCNFDIGDGVVSRFGIDTDSDDFRKAVELFRDNPEIRLKMLHCHFADRKLDYWPARVKGMIGVIRKVEEWIGYIPERIDFGGGIYGRMPDSLRRQFKCAIPEYDEYSECFSEFASEFPEYGPEIVIEPGSALVGDCMKYASRVSGIKRVRNKDYITVCGSQKNISMSTVNPPVRMICSDMTTPQMVENADIVGYTCIESDVLFRGYTGNISVGDYAVIENCGSYSIVMKPPFIFANCPVYGLKKGNMVLLKRQENFDDLFHTYVFDNN